jgi:hypothetical protein
MKTLLTLLMCSLSLVVSVLLLNACGSFLSPSEEFQDVTKRRSQDQVYFEDSVHVFFADFPNPYADKEVLWVSNYAGGKVDVYLHSVHDDSVDMILHFEPQQSPLYPLVYHASDDRMVKCVVQVDGREKCAKLYPRIMPLPHPQWGTTYVVERLR